MALYCGIVFSPLEGHPGGHFIQFSPLEGHPIQHFITFSPLEGYPRGHCTMFCPLEEHPRGHFTMFCPPKGHLIMFSPLEGHPRGHFTMFSPPEGHPRGPCIFFRAGPKYLNIQVFVCWFSILGFEYSFFFLFFFQRCVDWFTTSTHTLSNVLPAEPSPLRKVALWVMYACDVGWHICYGKWVSPVCVEQVPVCASDTVKRMLPWVVKLQ